MAWDEHKLAIEVVEQFAAATAWSSSDAFEAENIASARYRAYQTEYQIEYRHNLKVSPALLAAERERQRTSAAAHRARRKSEGKCTFCEEPQDPKSKALCTRHLNDAAQRDRIRRRGMQERMQELRNGVTHHFTIIAKCPKLKCVAGRIGANPCSRCNGSGVREVDGYLTCNTYDDGRLGEIFIRIGKSGNEEAIYEQWAIGASVALQFGVPVEAYFRKFLATQFEPAGATKNKDIPRCTSVIDYIARYILRKYCPVLDLEQIAAENKREQLG
jgi:hypothetical protein